MWLTGRRAVAKVRQTKPSNAVAYFDSPTSFFDVGLFYDDPTQPGAKRKSMNIIKLDLTDLSIVEAIAELQTIVTKMTGNATFTSISADVTALGTAVTALVTGNTDYNASLATSSAKLQTRGNLRVAAENLARTLASKAEGVTTDKASLENGGFKIRAAAAPVGLPAKPQSAAASLGDLDGTVDFHWNAIKRGVQAYVAQYATASSGPWTQFYVGKASSCTAGSLVSGTEYWFQSAAVGSAGQGPWSDPAKSRAT